MTRKIATLFIVHLFCLLPLVMQAQVTDAQKVEEARTFTKNKEYDKAFAVYDKLYLQDPQGIYTEYLAMLLEAKKYKDAEKLVKTRIALNNAYNLTEIDLGRVYRLQGNDKKANEVFSNEIKLVNGDDMLTQRMAKAFTDINEYSYAIAAYKEAHVKINNPYVYKPAIAQVYHKAGKLDSALDEMVGAIPMMVTAEQVKAFFLEWVGNDPEKLRVTRKMLLTRINEQPDNPNYAELLTWIFMQRNDWDGALIQVEAIDERNNEPGQRLLNFADAAITARQYDAAIKAYQDIENKGVEKPLFKVALARRLSTQVTKLKEELTYDSASVRQLMATCNDAFAKYPDLYATKAAGDYAYLAAQMADSINKGIKILEDAIAAPNIIRTLAGEYKLQMGDYMVIKGKIWDASLAYSQVDKQFRQDYLGEAARYRNARLAYYRGDFKWAQNMLNVLKASTTELIANDALNLSVLITENVKDSNQYPLQRYAYAELLMFRNKDKEAATLLDSISKAFPEHPLNDDIMMAHADLAVKHREYDKAIEILKVIADKFGTDVLGDDALFKIAGIYQYNLKNTELAKKYYEQLIIDFAGSTYVQLSRQRLKEIQQGTVTP